MSLNNTPISVTQLLMSIKNVLEQGFSSLSIEGEISNFTRHFKSQHCYFTLKDSQSQIPCVFFKGYAQFCPFSLEDGQKVVVQADMTLYPQQGKIQLMVKSVRLAGQGSLQQQFEEIKERLKKEGLFDSSRKRPLPRLAESVGILTSATGAVIQDIRKTFERRAPWVQLYLYPVRVQGEGAAQEIIHALQRWNTPDSGLPKVDVLIVGRGGGSLEDLWAFNEESLARAIAASKIPIISAVGHETDFTIADFVADKTASTPTAAAEIISSDKEETFSHLSKLEQNIEKTLSGILNYYSLKLDLYQKGILSYSPEKLLENHTQFLDDATLTLQKSVKEAFQESLRYFQKYFLFIKQLKIDDSLSNHAQHLNMLENHLNLSSKQSISHIDLKINTYEQILKALSPHSVLQRGFAIVKNNKGQIIRDISDAEINSKINITLQSIKIESVVLSSVRTTKNN